MKISYLVLDYDRPVEAKVCLKSLWEHSKFPFEVVYLSNGGTQDYVQEFYKEGLIHKLILRKSNSGCGLGTRELFKAAETEYVIYVQCDQFLFRPYTEDELNKHIYLTRQGSLVESDRISHIDLSGNQGHGQYSERAHLINRDFYNAIPNGRGGPGPYQDEKYTEQWVQEHLKTYNYKFYSYHYFADNGKVSIREYPCGGRTIHFTDEKKLFIDKPLAKKYNFPNLTDSEWDLVLAGKWEQGTIPEKEREHSFKIW